MTDKILNEYIDKIKNIIIDCVPTRRIILFGSAARGEMGPNSDIDLLVVVPVGQHRRKTAQQIYEKMFGVGFAVDLVVVNDEDLRAYSDRHDMVIKRALEEGREIYAA